MDLEDAVSVLFEGLDRHDVVQTPIVKAVPYV